MAHLPARKSGVDVRNPFGRDVKMQPAKDLCDALNNIRKKIESENPPQPKRGVLLSSISVLETFLSCSNITDDW